MKYPFEKSDAWFAGAVVAMVVTLVGLGALSNRSTPGPEDAQALRLSIDEQMHGWPETSRLQGEAMTERWGWPDAITPTALTWYHRGDWKRIVVHSAPAESPLEQAVSYAIPADREAALQSFGNGLRVERAFDELSAQSDTEELNMLVLNVAHRVAMGKLDINEAHAFFVTTASRSASGKSSPLMTKLEFTPKKTEQQPAFGWPRPPLY